MKRKAATPGAQVRPKPILTARYTDHPIARYSTNPLIRALPVLPDHLKLQTALTSLPDYSEDERNEERSVKTQRLQQLFRFYLGLPRVVELMETLYSMICEGYVGREPHSIADHELRQETYRRQQEGDFFEIDEDDNGAEFTAALIGIPGIGKSKALRRASGPFRKVIHHPEHDIYQIPALLIEMPYKGVSINALAHAIIRAIHEAFPQGNYYQLYLAGRTNAEVLFMDAVMLMQTHYVGLLLVDESQNQDYRTRTPSQAVRGQTPLATLLITATNASQIPMMMCGTPELNDILGKRMSMLRRTVGRGMRVWKPLSLPKTNSVGEVIDIGEFDVFLQVLWDFQWTKTPFELTPRMRNIFYFYTQGVSDFIIKLFHDVQLRAVRNEGDEVVDEALVHEVANDEMKALTTLTAAMRNMDYERTGQSADLAAYLRIDPHDQGFARQQIQLELEEDPAAEPGDDEEELEVPPEATDEPQEVPTGPDAKPKRRRKTKQAAAEKSPPAALPPMAPVDNLDSALGQ